MTASLCQNLASSNASSSLRAFSGEPLILTCRALRYHPTSPFPDSVISSNFPSNQTGLLCGSYIIIALCRHHDIYYLLAAHQCLCYLVDLLAVVTSSAIVRGREQSVWERTDRRRDQDQIFAAKRGTFPSRFATRLFLASTPCVLLGRDIRILRINFHLPRRLPPWFRGL